MKMLYDHADMKEEIVQKPQDTEKKVVVRPKEVEVSKFEKTIRDSVQM